MTDAPRDPRTDLPPLGSLPTVARVDDVAIRVLAPNPSPMTLDGTNTYVLADGDGTPAVVVDPGPEAPAHRAAVDQVLTDHDLEVAAVVATHHHEDHAASASAWADDWGVEVLAAHPDVADGSVVRAGDTLRFGGLRLDVIATPGHTADSISLRLPTGAVCTGDHILGRGTTVVLHPDGTLSGYLDSLRRLLDLGPAALLPGHGPAMHEDPTAVLEFHLAHRTFRLAQIRAVLAAGPRTAREVVETIYADYDRAVWPAATASTLAAFEHLAATDQIVLEGDKARLP